MKKPSIIYLDTSDFNNLYKGNLPSEISEVKSYLVDKVDLGEIKIGYSYPLIFELFRSYDEQHREDRLSKATFIKRLCGHNAHPHFADLDKGYSFPNEGVWIPREALAAFSPIKIVSNLKSRLVEKIDEQLPILNRKQRRALKTSSGVSQLMRYLPKRKLRVEDFDGIPISQSFLDGRYLERMLSGEISERLVSEKLTEWAMDPEAFVQIWYEYSKKANPLETFIDSQFDNLSEAMVKARESYQKSVELQKSIRAARRDYYDSLRKLDVPTEQRKSIQRLPPVDFSQYNLEKIDFTEKHGPRWKPFNTYMSAIISGKRQSKQSDLVDLIHLLYLPDVDLMRCDRQMSNLMEGSPWFDASKIVSRLRDLPSRIEELSLN